MVLPARFLRIVPLEGCLVLLTKGNRCAHLVNVDDQIFPELKLVKFGNEAFVCHSGCRRHSIEVSKKECILIM